MLGLALLASRGELLLATHHASGHLCVWVGDRDRRRLVSPRSRTGVGSVWHLAWWLGGRMPHAVAQGRAQLDHAKELARGETLLNFVLRVRERRQAHTKIYRKCNVYNY